VLKSPNNVIDAIVARTNRAWNRPSLWNLLIVLPWALRVFVHPQGRGAVLAGMKRWLAVPFETVVLCHNLPMCGRYRLSRRKQIVEEYFESVSDEPDWLLGQAQREVETTILL
jgi:hypothetical protein